MDFPVLATANTNLPLIAEPGTAGAVFVAPDSMNCPPGTLIFMSAAGFVPIALSDFTAQPERRCFYDNFARADAERRRGRFAPELPFHADDVVADLVDQIEGLGIEDWHGAEGLSLDAARKYLAGQALPDRTARMHQAELDATTWDEPDYPYASWQDEVANGDTRRSYASWVLAQREQEADADLRVVGIQTHG